MTVTHSVTFCVTHRYSITVTQYLRSFACSVIYPLHAPLQEMGQERHVPGDTLGTMCDSA